MIVLVVEQDETFFVAMQVVWVIMERRLHGHGGSGLPQTVQVIAWLVHVVSWVILVDSWMQTYVESDCDDVKVAEEGLCQQTVVYQAMMSW